MHRLALPIVAPGRRWSNVGLRWRVVGPLAMVMVGLFVVGASFVYDHALDDRHAIVHNAMAKAVTTATAIDREVAATASLLKGLSRSPSQGRRLPDLLRPAGRDTPSAGLVVCPLGRGPAACKHRSTIRDEAADLFGSGRAGGQCEPYSRPRRDDHRSHDRPGYRRARGRRASSPRRSRRSDDRFFVDGAPGGALECGGAGGVQPSGWFTMVMDRKLVPIAWSSLPANARPGEFSPVLRDHVVRASADQIFTVRDSGMEMLVAVHRSSATDYTTVTALPQAFADLPVNAALAKIGLVGLVLLLCGVFTSFFVVRQVSPVETTAAETARRLRLAEARYRSLWSDTPEGLFIVTVTEEGRFVFEGLNPVHARATGLTFDGIAGKEPEDCLPRDVAEAVLQRYRRCVETGVPEIYDEVLDLPGGRRHWQTSLSPVRDPDTGRICLLVGTARDVTEDREARAGIEQSRKPAPGHSRRALGSYRHPGRHRNDHRREPGLAPVCQDRGISDAGSWDWAQLSPGLPGRHPSDLGRSR